MDEREAEAAHIEHAERAERAEHAEPEQDLDPAVMLALLERQQQAFTDRVAGLVPLILVSWGLAWTLGYLALWLIDGLQPAFGLPIGAAVAIFAALLLAAIVISAVAGSRSGRGFRTASSGEAFTGIVYGVTWALGSVAIYGIAAAMVANGMPRELTNVLFPTLFVFFTGVMYVVGAAIWRAVPMLVLGIWLLVLAATVPHLGYPHHYLAFALAGGLPFLGLGLAQALRMRAVSAELARA